MDARRCHTSRKQVQWWGKKCGRIRTSVSNNLIHSHLKLHRNICLKLFSKSGHKQLIISGYIAGK